VSVATASAEEPKNHASQAITCRSGNICTYADGTAIPQATGQQPSFPTRLTTRKRPVAPTIYTLDGKSYTRDALIAEFLRVAFAPTLWFEGDGRARAIFKSPVITKRGGISGPSWVAEYITRSQGLPRFDALNRWNTQTITIGLDWPPDVWPLGDPSHHDIVLKHLATLSPQIQAATGMKVSILPPAHETPHTFAHVRIVTNAVFAANNQFKKPLKRTGGAVDGAMVLPMAATPPFEEFIFGSVPFTPSATRQVEGYFVPNNDNTIGFAVCKISPDHDIQIQKSLITECFIRALGLPDASLTADNSALGIWNQESNRERIVTANPVSEYLPIQLTEYDAFMLSLLYCPEIHPGMNRYDVLFSLYHSDVCLQSLQKEE
jgi:hypothetical protein